MKTVFRIYNDLFLKIMDTHHVMLVLYYIHLQVHDCKKVDNALDMSNTK